MELTWLLYTLAIADVQIEKYRTAGSDIVGENSFQSLVRRIFISLSGEGNTLFSCLISNFVIDRVKGVISCNNERVIKVGNIELYLIKSIRGNQFIRKRH